MALSHHMMQTTTTGAGLGFVLAVSESIQTGHFDPISVMLSTGACGIIAWVLLKSVLVRSDRDAKQHAERSEHDAKQRDEMVKLVMDLVNQQREEQSRATKAQVELKESLDEVVRTNRSLIEKIEKSPCLFTQKETVEILKKAGGAHGQAHHS